MSASGIEGKDEGMASPLSQAKVIAELASRIDKMELQQEQTARAAKATAEKVDAVAAQVQKIYDALMAPQPGYDKRSFLDRATELLLDVESSSRVFAFVVATGKIILAVGALIGAGAAGVAFIRYGGQPKP